MPSAGEPLPASRVLVVAGLIQRSLECVEFLVTRRALSGHLPGAWELPGGKVERGESPEEALHRELDEELGIQVDIGRVFSIGHHIYPKCEVVLAVYQTLLVSGIPECRVALEHKWVTPQQLARMEFPPANASFINALRDVYL